MAAAVAENFCLRWNDFQSNISSSFRELRDDSDFFDITLATSDSAGQTLLRAHKVILSACSDFFKQMLKQQSQTLKSHPSPLIYLHGISYNDLLSILDFMYYGEVNISQDELNSFLAVAEELQVKGLTNKDQSSGGHSETSGPSTSTKAARAASASSSGGPSIKRARRASGVASASSANPSIGKLNYGSEIKPEEVDIKLDPEMDEPEILDDEGASGYDESYGEYYGDEDDQSAGPSDGSKDYALQGHRQQPDSFGVVRLQDGQGKCLACGKQFSNFSNCRVHYKEVHGGVQEVFECHICGAKFTLARSRANHLMRKHGISQKMLKQSQMV